MITLIVYDPPMCCFTGVCSPEVDQQLVDFAADLDWLTAQGARVRRINLSQEPMELLEIDPEVAAQAYRDSMLGPIRGSLPEKAIKGIEAQLSVACTTEIAAFDEFTGLLTDEALVGGYDHIIFDTAPTGQTIRLLSLPGAWMGFLKTGTGDPSCFGPLAGLERQRARYAAAVASLSDASLTRLILVARPRASSLREAARTSHELAAIGITNQYLAIDGLMPEDAKDDALAVALVAKDTAPTGTRHPLLAARAATEAPEIAAVRDRLASRRAGVPMLPQIPVGLARLRALIGAAPEFALA